MDDGLAERRQPAPQVKSVIDEQSKPNLLSYESPQILVKHYPPANVLAATMEVLFGFAESALISSFISAILFRAMNGYRDEGHHLRNQIAGATYLLAFIFIAGKTVQSNRNCQRLNRRWWLLGQLLGLGCVCLIMGVCFVAS